MNEPRSIAIAGTLLESRRRCAFNLEEVPPSKLAAPAFEGFAPDDLDVTSVVGTIAFLKMIVVAHDGSTLDVDFGIPVTHGRPLHPVRVTRGALIRVLLPAVQA